MDGTPIFDIKPYVPYADSHPDAASGFAPDEGRKLRVEFPPGSAARVPEEKLEACGASWPGTPAPDTRASRGVYTPWNLPPWR